MKRNATWVVIAIIVLGAVLPVALWWAGVARVPWVTPTEAKQALANDANTVLVDVLPESMFRDRHIDGAVHWPLSDVRQATSPDDIPAGLQGKRLLLVCEVGINSTTATRHLRRIGVTDAVNVRGGKQDWVGSLADPVGGRYDQWRTGDGAVEPFELRHMSAVEELLAAAGGFGFRAAYSPLALIVTIILWRMSAACLRALKWAMVALLLGDSAAAANYAFFSETSYLLEYLHSYGMVVCLSLTTYALIEAIDRRILKRMSYLTIPAAMILAAMPLCAHLEWGSYNAVIYGSLHNYSHAVAHQLYELRICPVAAIIAMAVSALVLLAKRSSSLPAVKIAFAVGAGPLGFALLRMILLKAYSDNLMWFVFWEEATELVFILAVCITLWIFRRGLSQQVAASRASSSTPA